MSNDRTPAIRILRFWTEYGPDKRNPGQMTGIDWVEWGKIGDRTGATTRERVHALKPRELSGTKGGFHEPVEWAAVGPAYEKWKANEAIPENGTPLAAWPGADRALVDALKGVNVLTVEDFAGTPDHALAGIPIPDLRRRKKMAEDFLLAQGDVSAMQAELSKRDDQIDRQARQIADMQEQLAALVAASETKKSRAKEAA